MPNILIDLAAEFTGKKAFDKAGSSTAKLEKGVKSLGRTFGVAFSTAAVLAYGKASVKAAAADIKAQQQLALALKNVGLERDAATAEGYIQRIEKEFAIVDEKLRPSYSRLAIATRDTAETQRLMGIAMDISASTGKDLDSVTSALSKAYLGNNTALSKLGVGISKAELKTKSFDEITNQLAATFAGAAKKSADSVAGSMDKLAIATNNAKETIGVGLLTAFSNLAGNGDVDKAVSKIDSVAESLSKMIVVASKLKWYDWVIGGITGGTITDITKFKGMGNVPMTGGSNQDFQKYEASQKKIAAAKSKADKLAAANKIKADKAAAENAAKLSKAAALFDLDKIQIEAALKGKITDEETLRLRLQQAILNEDATTAEKLQKQLEASQRATAQLTGQLYGIKPLDDPFAEWIKSLKEIGETLSKILGMPVNTSSSMLNPNQPIVAQQDPNSTIQPKTNVDPIPVVVIPDPTTPVMPTTNMPTPTSGGFGFSLPSYITSGANFAGGPYTPPVQNITVNIEGMIDTGNFDEVVNQAFVNAQRKGLSQSPAGSLP